MSVLVSKISLEERGLTATNYLLTMNQLKEPVFNLLKKLNGGICPSKYSCPIPVKFQSHDFLTRPYQYFEIDPWNGVITFYTESQDGAVSEVMSHLHWEFAQLCLSDVVLNMGN
jgi:hypothetical protein